jgi:protein-disulfide isomerase
MRSLAFISVFAFSLICSATADHGQALADTSRRNVSVTAFDRTLGNAGAPVTLIEYGAPSCPVCAHFNANVFPLIKQKYVDTGKVRYVFRVFPLRAEDGEAEKLARCVPKSRYFQFMDLLFGNQSKWDPEFAVSDSRTALLNLAESIGIAHTRAIACIDDAALDTTINRNANEAQIKYGVTGTPTFVIDGAPQSPGYRSFDELSALLDAKRTK